LYHNDLNKGPRRRKDSALAFLFAPYCVSVLFYRKVAFKIVSYLCRHGGSKAKKFRHTGRNPKRPKRLIFVGSVDKDGNEMTKKHESSRNRPDKGEVDGGDLNKFTENPVSFILIPFRRELCKRVMSIYINNH